MKMMAIEVNENNIKALQFVKQEEERNAEIEELNHILGDVFKRLKELDATIQYGYRGDWYDVHFIESINSTHGGYVNEIRIHKKEKYFSL